MDMKQEWLLLIELMIASISMEQDQNGKFYSSGDERIYMFLKAFQAQLVGGFYDTTIELSETMAHEAANRSTDAPPAPFLRAA